jgi:NAD(P)-dependent dehydrogenase (short-subunit alcohol dehydrogenase family)
MSDILSMAGRTALVTGAGQGVGRQVALHIADHGGAVVVNDFHGPRAEEVAGEIVERGGKALGVRADVTDLDDLTALVERANAELGPIDVLVNNAGNAGPTNDAMEAAPPFWETDPKDWDRWVGTNFFGVLNAARAVLPGMVERKYGRIVSVISDAGRTGEPNLAVYGGAKAGAAGFSRGLAKAVGRHGVTVNCVALSTIDTPGVATALADPELVRKALRGYVIRRFGQPTDAANAILFLASDAASWVTGQTYPVNGGYAITP